MNHTDQTEMPPTPQKSLSAAQLAAFARSSWFLILANLAVVVWGAFVRASKSGDGCGAHWPQCNGSFIPLEPSVKTLIEFTHRGMVGLVLLFTIVLLVRAFLLFPKGHAVRLGMSLTLFFTLTEGGIGAALVLLGLVGSNDSAVRAIVLAAHLVNTFLLLASLAYACWASAVATPDGESPRLRLSEQGGVLWVIGGGLFLTLWVSVSGVIAALGDQLKPIDDLGHAITLSMNPTAHFLDRLRLLHPTVAIATTIFIVVMTTLVPRLRPAPATQKWGRIALTVFCFQIGFGLLNAWMKAPVWMQLVHLMIADSIWLSLVFMSFSALKAGAPRAALEAAPQPVVDSAGAVVSGEGEVALPGPATWKDYIMLTKPRVISLLIVTTWTAMVMAQRGWPGFNLMLFTGIGFYMAAGGAHAINMVIDRDIDKRTERTAKRAVAAGRISVRNALIFACTLCVGAFLILWKSSNLLSALMAMSGLAFYVIVYTLLLKRRTWSNIVIGGAAGAFPPLVGWAAVTGNLAPLAWLLFGIIFLWTPVHFWALAILLKDDYAKNGIPMLPVVKGERATAWQIVWYAVLTIAISLAPFALRDSNGAIAANWLYGVCALALNGVLMWRCILLYRDPARPRASWLFHYSMLYLFLLFLALAVDRAVINAAV